MREHVARGRVDDHLQPRDVVDADDDVASLAALMRGGPDATTPYVNALARLDRDVLSQAGVKYVTLLEGINDIGQTCLGNATLTPFQGAMHDTPSAGYSCSAGEDARGQLNNWIRTSGEFDGVIDFDQATRDPANPLAYRPEFDSGDHLHPNDAGYQAMANAIDLALSRLRCVPC